MRLPVQIKIGAPSDHFSEIVLLGLIAGGVVYLLSEVIETKTTGWDIAACLLVLQGIISAIKERWTQRSVDRMGQQLGQSVPGADTPLSAAEGAQDAAQAAKRKAEQIARQVPDDPEARDAGL